MEFNLKIIYVFLLMACAIGILSYKEKPNGMPTTLWWLSVAGFLIDLIILCFLNETPMMIKITITNL